MNRSIRRVAIVAAVMVLAMLVNITASYLLRSDSLNNNPQNRRVREAQFAQPRGAILVGNTPVVQTVPAKGQFPYLRTYSDGPMYAPVSGYFSFVYGRSKLEQVYNSQLTGTDDAQAISRLVDQLWGRQPVGASLQTTIIAKAQRAAWNGLKGQKGAVVAIDYTTGAILAYVSTPSYDPSVLSSADLNATQKAWSDLNADPDRPMADRAGREIYPPGSSFKLITAAAALESGLTPESKIDAPAELPLPNSSMKMQNSNACGGTKVTLEQALRVSCNTAFGKLGMDLGQDALRAQAEKFGFNSSFGGDINSATSKFPSDLDEAQLAMSAIGQYDVAATPLQMAVVAGAIANDGLVMQPYIVSEVRNADLSVVSQQTPVSVRQAVSVATAQQLQQMMQTVVSSGTGTRAQVAGLTVGGKTGTAQSDMVRAPYAWFTGYATQLHVAICVFVEDAGADEDQSGGRTAAPIFAQVLSALK